MRNLKIHNEIDYKIDSNTLDEVGIILSTMREINFQVIYAEDSSEYYICVGKKEELK